jgi:MFS family permease
MSGRVTASRGHLRLGSLWSHADFMKLWLGQSVSLFGSQVTLLALPLTAVLVLNATPMQMALLSAAEFAPYLFVTMFAGLWIDHKRRRPILIMSDIGRAVLLGIVPVLAIIHQLNIVYLFVIAFLLGILTVFFQLAYEAYLPRLVDAAQLTEGNSKMSVSASLAELAGPGLAGLLVQLFTAPFAILLDVCSFLVSAVSLLLMRHSEQVLPPVSTHIDVWGEINAGFRATLKNRYLLAFAGEAAIYNLFWQMIQAIFVFYAVRELHLSALLIGGIFAVGSVGALLGALLVERLARRFNVGHMMVGSQMLSDFATFLIPLSAIIGSQTGAIVCMMLALFLRGGGNTACNVYVNSVRQAIVPDELRGRTNAVYRLVVSGVVALGALLGGVLSERIGVPFTLLVGAIGVSCSWLCLFWSPVSRLQSIMAKPE